jgi:hypothetical protein
VKLDEIRTLAQFVERKSKTITDGFADFKSLGSMQHNLALRAGCYKRLEDIELAVHNSDLTNLKDRKKRR